MTEKELIGKIRELRQIRPGKDWVSLTKSQILGEETPQFELFPFFKPAYAGLFFLLLLVGLIELSQGALPGDPLYSLKRITEKAQTVFVLEEEKPKAQMELTEKRLEELAKVAQTNRVQNLAPALNELKASKKEVAKLIKNKPKEEAIKVAKEIAPKIAEINEKEKQVFASLGIESETSETIGSEEYKSLAEREIENFKNSSLTENQEKLLKEAEEYFEEGDYVNAFIKALETSQTR